MINDPVSVAVHPARAFWAFWRPAIVFLPIWGMETFSPLWTARFAALGLVLLVSPLAMPKPNPMQREYSTTDALGAWLVAAFNNLVAVSALGGFFYLIRKMTGFQAKADWLFIDLHLFPTASPHPHSEEIATGAWIIALMMVFTKSCIWSKMVITQGAEGVGYRPADMMPTKTATARQNLLRSLAWGLGGFFLGWLGLCFIYNYTALLSGYDEMEGHRTVGILMVLGLLLGHPI